MIGKNRDNEESNRFWDSARKVSLEVAKWPDWKRENSTDVIEPKDEQKKQIFMKNHEHDKKYT